MGDRDVNENLPHPLIGEIFPWLEQLNRFGFSGWLLNQTLPVSGTLSPGNC